MKVNSVGSKVEGTKANIRSGPDKSINASWIQAPVGRFVYTASLLENKAFFGFDEIFRFRDVSDELGLISNNDRLVAGKGTTLLPTFSPHCSLAVILTLLFELEANDNGASGAAMRSA